MPWCHPAVENCCNEGLASEADPVVDIDNVRDVKSVTSWMIIGNGLDLLPEDKQLILSGQWLNCRIIFSWQFLLKQEHPQVGGLQPTFGQFQPKKREMVQVLNSGGNRWVAVSNIGCSLGRVQWLDSLHCLPSLSQQRIVADLLQATVDEIVIETMNVQKQLGGSDCGLFALAFITAVLNNQDPTAQCFEQNKMRRHLIECLERKTPFPVPITKRQQRQGDILHTMVVPIYCVCHLPDDGSQMVQCSNCFKWYHVKCVVTDSTERMVL